MKSLHLPVSLTYITVALVAFSCLMFELLQTRVLSFIFWNHLVYLTISVAMLGFGISGTLVAIFSRKIRSVSIIGQLLVLFGLSMILSVTGTAYLSRSEFGTALLKTIICYVLYLPPYVLSGAILSIVFAFAKQSVGKIYAVDLLSAGLACLCFFIGLPIIGAPKIVLLLGLLMLCLGWRWLRRKDNFLRWISLAGGLTVLSFFFLGQDKIWQLVPADNKEFYQCMNFSNGAKLEKTIWTPINRIDVIGGGGENLPCYAGFLPKDCDFKILTQDGTAHTQILSGSAVKHTLANPDSKLSKHGSTLVYAIKPDADVAVIGVGGGIDVIRALGHGAKSVVGAELNPVTYRLLTSDYADYVGNFFKDPKVTLINDDGRTMLRTLEKPLDILQIVAIDTFSALSSGAYVLSENYLYTVEAFTEYMSRLKDNGILSVYRWAFVPPRESLRLCSLACEAMRRRGSNTIDKQIFVVDDNGWRAAFFKNSPYTEDEVVTLKTECAKRKLAILYFPKLYPEVQQKKFEDTYYNTENKCSNAVTKSSKAFNDLVRAYAAGNETQFFSSYPFQVNATTDDRPFFFEYQQKNAWGLPEIDKLRGNAASMTLYIVLLESLIFSLVAIFLPLWKFEKGGIRIPKAAELSVYFAVLGLGFMIIEVSLMQKCVLFLGSSLYSLSVVLATLLVSAGVGSALVGRANWTMPRFASRCGLALAVLMLFVIFGLNTVFYSLLHLPIQMRVLTTMLVISPVGIFLGMFFPMGLSYLRKQAKEFIPWAWGINGCMSVFGSFMAIVLAMQFGFNLVLWLGLTAYIVATLLALRLPDKQS